MEVAPQDRIDADAAHLKPPNKAARVLMVLGVVAIVGAVNWFTSPTRRPPGQGSGTPQGEQHKLPSLPFAAKEITASKWLNTKGKALKLADLKGEIVLLEFWRFLCTACEAGAQMVNELEKEFGEKIKFVTVHSAGGPEEQDEVKMKQWMEDKHVVTPTAVDHNKKTITDFGYQLTTPTFLLINRKGNVVSYQPSQHSKPVLVEQIKKLLTGDDLEKAAKEGKTGAPPPPGSPLGLEMPPTATAPSSPGEPAKTILPIGPGQSKVAP